MADHFERALRAASRDAAAHTVAPPAETVRARGDRLRNRRRAATAAFAMTIVAGIGGAVLATTLSAPHPTPPAGPGPAATSDAPSPHDTARGHRKSGAGTHDCRTRVVTPSTKEAVTRAYRRAQPDLVHIAPEKGVFYYGTCGKTAYAATSFRPTGGATLREQVTLQDEGGATKYFRKEPGGPWVYVATDGLPRSPKGCAAIPQIPHSLAKAWNDCGRQTGGHSRRSGEVQPSS